MTPRKRSGTERPRTSSWCHALSWLALVALLGCGDGGEVGAPDSGPDTHHDSGVDAMEPGLMGVLADEDGQPLGHEMVLACMATVCLFGETEADGRFFFAIDSPAAVALKTPEDLATVPRRAAALCPVAITGDSTVEVGTLHVAYLPQGAPIGPVAMDPQTLNVGDGLELTLRRGDLSPRIGDVLVDAAARLIPPAKVCPLLSVQGEEIIAVYALHPFAATCTSPIAVRAPSNLPSGTAVNFRTISEIDGHLSEPAPGHADGTAVATDLGAGIRELTWLVISR